MGLDTPNRQLIELEGGGFVSICRVLLHALVGISVDISAHT
jgi:hypothetical protein